MKKSKKKRKKIGKNVSKKKAWEEKRKKNLK